MPRIQSFELLAVELPFRKPFKHAAAERATSYSLFLKCTTDTGVVGFGECLPREYVTGESRDDAFRLLREAMLPKLVGRDFACIDEVQQFLRECDGKSPGWVADEVPQTAAWCAVDLALLDTFGREFGVQALHDQQSQFSDACRYSGVLSADKGFRLLKSALKQRIFGGLRQAKLKVDSVDDINAVRLLKRVFGRALDVRVDANMAWTQEEARTTMAHMGRYGVSSFEQPLAAENWQGAAALVAQTGLGVMADESFIDRASLQQLIEHRACTAVNLRVSKCGGLVASLNRAKEALAAGLSVQLGCQVGESSLLSAAQLILARCIAPITYMEGCFGLHLLREDPVSPVLQFGYGGRPPLLPADAGLGVTVDEERLQRWVVDKAQVRASIGANSKTECSSRKNKSD